MNCDGGRRGSGDYGSSNDIGVAYGPNGQLILLALMARSAFDDRTSRDFSDFSWV